MKIEMQISGADEIQKKLAMLTGRKAKEVVRKSTRDGLKVMASALKTQLPVRTGALRRSVAVRVAKKQRTGEYSINVAEDTKKEPRLIKYSKGSYSDLKTKKLHGKRYYYPAALEYGTKKLKARHYFKRIYDSVGRTVIETVIRKMRVRLEGLVK